MCFVNEKKCIGPIIMGCKIMWSCLKIQREMWISLHPKIKFNFLKCFNIQLYNKAN